ncbi:MAG: zinc-dependent peptidase [Bacteroidota bacterium]
MPANRLLVLCSILSAVGLYLTYYVDDQWLWLIIVGLVLSVTTYVFSPKINWWWWQRNPPDLAPELAQLLAKHHLFYQALSAPEQREFRRRVFLFNAGTNYLPQGLDKVPQDIQVIIAAAPVTMTFSEADFLFPKFENVVVYPHIFPSPTYKEQFHASEVYVPDGVLMFCLEHVLRGFVHPQQYLNLAWYEYAKVFQLSYPAYDYGDWSSTSWEDLERVSQFSRAALERWVGLPKLDLRAMGIALFFLYPAGFQQHLPVLYDQLTRVFSSK